MSVALFFIFANQFSFQGNVYFLNMLNTKFRRQYRRYWTWFCPLDICLIFGRVSFFFKNDLVLLLFASFLGDFHFSSKMILHPCYLPILRVDLWRNWELYSFLHYGKKVEFLTYHVKMHHSTLEIDTFKVLLLLSFFFSNDGTCVYNEWWYNATAIVTNILNLNHETYLCPIIRNR